MESHFKGSIFICFKKRSIFSSLFKFFISEETARENNVTLINWLKLTILILTFQRFNYACPSYFLICDFWINFFLLCGEEHLNVSGYCYVPKTNLLMQNCLRIRQSLWAVGGSPHVDLSGITHSAFHHIMVMIDVLIVSLFKNRKHSFWERQRSQWIMKLLHYSKSGSVLCFHCTRGGNTAYESSVNIC